MEKVTKYSREEWEKIERNIRKEFINLGAPDFVREVGKELEEIYSTIKSRVIEDGEHKYIEIPAKDGLRSIIRIVKDGYEVMVVRDEQKEYFETPRISFNNVLKYSLEDKNDFDGDKKKIEDNGYIFTEE